MKIKVFLLAAMTVLLTACPSPDDDFGNLKKDQIIATGGVSDVTPFSATIRGRVSPDYMAICSNVRVTIVDDKGNYWYEGAGALSGSKFEINVKCLYPNGKFTYYCTAEILENEFTGETRSFSTPSCNLQSGAVDMGLSVRWRSCNLGAYDPSDLGNYYKWPGSNYDIASSELGGNWRTPTKSEADELVNRCDWHGGYLNGVEGCYVVGPSGGIIFIPTADLMTSDRYGSYRLIWGITLSIYGPRVKNYNLDSYMEIRPVCD